LSITWYPQDSETATDPDGAPAACTYGIKHVNGSTVVAAGTAATHGATGVFTATIDPPADPAQWVVTWSAVFGGKAATQTTYVDVIGSHLIDLSEIRAMDAMSDTTAYPTALLAERRNDAEVLFELVTGQYWSHHYALDVLDGDPNYRGANQSAIRNILDYSPWRRLMLSQRLPQKLLALTIDGVQVSNVVPSGTATATSATSLTDSGGTAVVNRDVGLTITAGTAHGIVTANTATTWTVGGGWLDKFGASTTTPASNAAYSLPSVLASNYALYESGELEAGPLASAFARGVQNITAEYVCGADAVPQDLRLALAKYIQALVLESNSRIPDRATSLSTDFGTFRIGQAKAWDAPTGYGDIDAVLMRYGTRVPGFA